MSTDHISKLFGDLRSALNKKDLFGVHNVSKEIIKTDQKYYQDVVVNYVSTELNNQGFAMSPDGIKRIEHFKAWVREEINIKDEIVRQQTIQFFVYLVTNDESSFVLHSHEGKRTTDLRNKSLEFPSSAKFLSKAFGTRHYALAQDYEDALWVVLDEHGLL